MLAKIESSCRSVDGGLIVYSGYEYQDRCFYLPDHFSKPLLDHLLKRADVYGEEWIPIESFEELPLSSISVIKYFGSSESAAEVEASIREQTNLEVSTIGDPFNPSYSLMLATAKGVDKGATLLELKRLLRIKGPTIAAGDDENDALMLDQADISIAMGNAPDAIKKRATLIAPDVAKMGIIEGLHSAINQIGLT